MKNGVADFEGKTLSLDKAGRYILKATALLPGDNTKKASAVNRKMVRGVSGDVMVVPGEPVAIKFVKTAEFKTLFVPLLEGATLLRAAISDEGGNACTGGEEQMIELSIVDGAVDGKSFASGEAAIQKITVRAGVDFTPEVDDLAEGQYIFQAKVVNPPKTAEAAGAGEGDGEEQATSLPEVEEVTCLSDIFQVKPPVLSFDSLPKNKIAYGTFSPGVKAGFRNALGERVTKGQLVSTMVQLRIKEVRMKKAGNSSRMASSMQSRLASSNIGNPMGGGGRMASNIGNPMGGGRMASNIGRLGEY
jgi:hypothetical protein